jgi:hypothetical protein
MAMASVVWPRADRAERHGAGGEALDDFFGGLDLVEGIGVRPISSADLDPEQAADRQ